MNFFDNVNEFIRDVEGSVVNLLASIAPWFAPLPAAYMSFWHMTSSLLYPVYIATPVAIMIEILGFSTISTGLDFWSWNRRYKSGGSLKRAPLGFVAVAFGYYLFVIISMNVVLDIAKSFPDIVSERWSVIGVQALLTTMTIPAGLIVATRVQHKELLDEIKQLKLAKKMKVSESFNTEPNKAVSWRTFSKTLSGEEMEFIATAPIQEVINKYGLIERTAYNWQEYAKKQIYN